MMTNNPDEKEYYLDRPENVQRLLRVFYMICAVLVAADFIVHRHTTVALEEFPAFYAIFGFVAFVMLVIGSIALRKLVMRKEDYYDVDD
jgi:hypothetical protein